VDRLRLLQPALVQAVGLGGRLREALRQLAGFPPFSAQGLFAASDQTRRLGRSGQWFAGVSDSAGRLPVEELPLA